MKITELRLGNWIIEDGQPGTVIAITHALIDVQDETQILISVDVPGDEVCPIPLTEEWLLRLGFVHYESYKEEGYYQLGPIQINHFTFLEQYKFDGWGWEFDGNNEPVQTHFVHQLQNLYFALTGEELTIKE